MKMYLLVSANGYNISPVMQTTNLEEAKDALRKEYSKCAPSDWMEEYKALSFCGDAEAALYLNGEDVFLWSIIGINVPVNEQAGNQNKED